jgi:hypothetical protein
MRHGTYIQDFQIQNFHQVLLSPPPIPCCLFYLVGPRSLALWTWLFYILTLGLFLSVCSMLWVPVLPSGCICLLLVPWFSCLVDGFNAICSWFFYSDGPSLTSASICQLLLECWCLQLVCCRVKGWGCYWEEYCTISNDSSVTHHSWLGLTLATIFSQF